MPYTADVGRVTQKPTYHVSEARDLGRQWYVAMEKDEGGNCTWACARIGKNRALTACKNHEPARTSTGR